jgi:hypothetical protein
MDLKYVPFTQAMVRVVAPPPLRGSGVQARCDIDAEPQAKVVSGVPLSMNWFKG